MYTAQAEDNGPSSIRYPRGTGTVVDWKTPFKKIKIGTGRRVKNGDDIAILTIGDIGNKAVSACAELEKQGIHIAHYDMRFVKPIDEILLHEVFGKFKKIITVENGCIQGGMGSAVLEFMADNNYYAEVKRLGIPDKFIDHGTQNELYNECLFDEKAIIATTKSLLEKQENKVLA